MTLEGCCRGSLIFVDGAKYVVTGIRNIVSDDPATQKLRVLSLGKILEDGTIRVSGLTTMAADVDDDSAGMTVFPGNVFPL